MSKKLTIEEIIKEIKEVAEVQQRINESLQEKLKRLGFPDAESSHSQGLIDAVIYNIMDGKIIFSEYPNGSIDFEMTCYACDTQTDWVGFAKTLVSDDDFIAVQEFIEFLRK